MFEKLNPLEANSKCLVSKFQFIGVGNPSVKNYSKYSGSMAHTARSWNVPYAELIIRFILHSFPIKVYSFFCRVFISLNLDKAQMLLWKLAVSTKAVKKFSDSVCTKCSLNSEDLYFVETSILQ